MDSKRLAVPLLAVLLVASFGCVSPQPPIGSQPPVNPPSTTPGVPTPAQANAAGSTDAGVQALVNANNQFSLELYSNLKDQEAGNVFFSPYSISTALAMAYEGARGPTAEEMRSVFHFPAEAGARRPNFAALYNKINAGSADYQLKTANALWVQQDYQLLGEYTRALASYYGGKATNVDFAGATEQARQTINQWVEGQTNGKIKDLFPEGALNPDSRLVLTNAVYFKGTWLKQFDKADTREEDFTLAGGQTVKVPMMNRTDPGFYYAETEKVQILEMLYKGKELSMLVLLPKDGDLAALEKSLSSKNLAAWKGQLREQRVVVSLPKFTFKTNYTLNGPLMALGMPLAFSDAADFSGIDGAKDLSIQAVVHQAFVEVNEEGTEAAAATGVSMGLTSVPQITEFRADHPFLFLIQERKTGNLLFVGRVADPTK